MISVEHEHRSQARVDESFMFQAPAFSIGTALFGNKIYWMVVSNFLFSPLLGAMIQFD